MDIKDIIKEENKVYSKTSLLTDKTLSYCPGCGHGTTHRILMEVVDELGLQSETIGIAPVGCSVLAYEFMDIDMSQAAHGRAPAVPTGLKRLWPVTFVLPIKEMATLLQLERQKLFMPVTGAKI